MHKDKLTRNILWTIIIAIAVVLIIVFGKHFFFENIMPIIRHYDGVMKSRLTYFTTSITPTKLLGFFWVTLFYGFLHSAAPGHGKAIITTYFLNHEEKLSSALVLGGVMSLVHFVISVFVSYSIVGMVGGIEQMFNLEIRGLLVGISGLLIMSLGMFLLFHELAHHDHCSHSCSMSKYSSPAILGLFAGLVPCPVTIFLMTFAITHNIPVAGLVAVLGLSVGMFLLVSLIGVTVVLGRGKILKGLEYLFSEEVEKISSVLELISASIIALIGAGMALSFFL